MKKNVFFLVFAVIVLFFSACSEYDDILDQEIDSEIVIKMSVPGDESGEFKSAMINDPIQNGDTVDIYDLKSMNIVFSAENQTGKDLPGMWHISLWDCDNDTEKIHLSNRPKEFFTNSNLASIKPSVFGLYLISFEFKGKNFMFFLRHKGLPGTIGDGHENNYAFRMEAIDVQDITKDWETRKAYTLYLQVNFDQFEGWGESDGMSPNNPEEWKALLFCGGDNFFETSNGQILNAKNFKLRKCRYTSEEYVCFTFFPEENPAIDFYGGGKNYRVQFYAGEYGESWWTFSSAYHSNWNLGFGSEIQFLML